MTESTGHMQDQPRTPMADAPAPAGPPGVVSGAARAPRVAFFGLTAHEFDGVVTGWGWPRFRAQQVRDWVYGRGVTDPAEMTNLSKRDAQTLRERVTFAASLVAARQASSDGTRKLLLRWDDADEPDRPGAGTGSGRAGLGGGTTRIAEPPIAECVMIPDGDRRTACISSQVGCPVGCKFCASGINGVKGNLSAAQIVEQVYRLNEMPGGGNGATQVRSEDGGEKGEPAHASSLRRSAVPSLPSITNIVFMGMGEPLSNYANVMKAVAVLHDPTCFNLGARRITISTVGVPARMRQLAGEGLPINLAVSLHAPNEPLRRQLIPWAEHFAIEDILDAARFYFDRTGREVTLEYILLSGVNDRPEHARELVRLCKTVRANVNLIRYNEVAGLPFIRPKGEDVVRFQAILRAHAVNAHVRKSRGRDIDAACGQLRRKEDGRVARGLVSIEVRRG